ncbi:MAG: ATP-binding protein [Leptothrix ochracea]|uniref:sensor histidine kinase n=1 Tax=Leptothrix ochracea TaxID=735331 RepID=UPI0034E23A25
MRLRHLYLNIYVTVLLVLMVFALVAMLIVRHHTAAQHGQIERAVIHERMSAWVELLEHSLPPAEAPSEDQAQALLTWAQRLRMGIALDDAAGHRLATSALYAQRQNVMSNDDVGPSSRFVLSDGRVLWVLRGGGLRPLNGGAGEYGGRARHLPPPEERASVVLGGLALLFLAIAAGSYPVVRRLTRRLEALQKGVEAFGAGHLGQRVSVDGRDEIAALAQSFNLAASRIEELVRANQSLLANASHEFRSPLARLKMALAMLPTTPEHRRPALQAEIDRDIDELNSLVEEVLLASRLEARTALSVERVDLLGLAAEECARVGAELVVGATQAAAPELDGDERLLRRALRNLLENGRRYGGDEVSLHLETSATALRLAICDRGPGVPEAERERIFESFYRLPGHTEGAGGVGLGLSLVRQIAQRHKGSVCCEAREGGGSCFVLTLPLHPVTGSEPVRHNG